MGLLNFSHLSILALSNVTSVKLSIYFLLIFKTKESSSFISRTINWNLPGSTLNDLILNQVKTLLRFSFKISKNSNLIFLISNSLLELFKVLSSAKLHTLDNVITKNKPFMNILRSKGPKIEPWETPLIISYQELYEGPIFVLCLRGER